MSGQLASVKSWKTDFSYELVVKSETVVSVTLDGTALGARHCLPMTLTPPHGVLPVLQTPFDDSGRVDETTLRREIDWAFECGVDGVTVAMVSEVLRLDASERRDLAALICAAVAGRGPVIISVGAESTKAAVALTEQAQDIGASAVMAIPPLSVTLAADELERYYDALAEATPLPVVVQDASSYVGSALSIDLQASLYSRHGDRLAFKPETQPLGPRLSALHSATGGQVSVYDGSGGIALIDTFRRGIIGTMPSTDLCWAIVRLWEHLQAGNYESAYRLSLPLIALVSMQTSLDAYIVIEKYLLLQQKVFVNTVCREPVGFHLDDQTALQLDAYFGMLKDSYEEVGPAIKG
jgi:dihydrodipicolinate synthase/N-acetylneuraminate lyase